MSLLPSSELAKRLASVERYRRKSLSLAFWRSAIVISCATGLLCLANSSYWQIQRQSQIKIIGNNLVSKKTIKQILDFSYPQFIWSINSGKLTAKLAATPSIAAAKVSKQIFPPQLTVSLQERYPVALALESGKIGFLDAEGQWIDRDFYGNIGTEFPVPQLKLIDFEERYRSHWLALYRLISNHSTVRVSEISWDKSGGVFLRTEIGLIYLGSDLSRLTEQFEIILRLRTLSERLASQDISYIDLSNPDLNLIQKYQ